MLFKRFSHTFLEINFCSKVFSYPNSKYYVWQRSSDVDELGSGPKAQLLYTVFGSPSPARVRIFHGPWFINSRDWSEPGPSPTFLSPFRYKSWLRTRKKSLDKRKPIPDCIDPSGGEIIEIKALRGENTFDLKENFIDDILN